MRRLNRPSRAGGMRAARRRSSPRCPSTRAAAGAAAVPAVPEQPEPARAGCGKEGGPDRVDGLRRRQAQRLHGGRAGFHPRAPDQFPEGRRDRHRRQSASRTTDRPSCSAAGRSQSRRMGGQCVGGSGRRRARDLGGSHGRRAGLARRRRHRAGAGAGRQLGAILKEGEIYRARGHAVAAAEGDGSRREGVTSSNWGVQSAPRWSPDGRKIAFVTTRQDHSFIAVLDVATRKISYMDPSVDFDTSPMWTRRRQTHHLLSVVPACRSGSRVSRVAAASAFPTGPAFNAEPGPRPRRPAAATRRARSRAAGRDAGRGEDSRA